MVARTREFLRVTFGDDTLEENLRFIEESLGKDLRFWINDPMNGLSNVKSEVLLGIWDRFHAHGIEIPFPQRDLHLRSVSPQARADLTLNQPPSAASEGA